MNQKQFNAIKEEYSNMDWEDFREGAGDLLTREFDIYNTVVIEGVPALIAEVERLQKRLAQTEKCYEIMEKATFKASEMLTDARNENEKLREALREIFELAKHDGISKHLDNCYIVARQALGGEKK